MKDLFDFSVAELKKMSILELLAMIGNLDRCNKARVRPGHPRHRERLVDVRNFDLLGNNYYGVMKNPPVPDSIEELLVRGSLIPRLRKIDRFLRADKMRLSIKDAWRPLALQRSLPRLYTEEARKRNPEWSDEKLRTLVSERFAEVPEGNELLLRPPPHCTGGAIDVEITDNKGTPLPVSRSREFTNLGYWEEILARRRLAQNETQMLQNTRLLFWVMWHGGFVPYVKEWWHWEWGTRRAARVKGADMAPYGYVESP